MSETENTTETEAEDLAWAQKIVRRVAGTALIVGAILGVFAVFTDNDPLEHIAIWTILLALVLRSNLVLSELDLRDKR